MLRVERKPGIYELFVGVDIAAESARVALLKQDGAAEAEFSIAQTTSGMTELKQALLATKRKRGDTVLKVKRWQHSLLPFDHTEGQTDGWNE